VDNGMKVIVDQDELSSSYFVLGALHAHVPSTNFKAQSSETQLGGPSSLLKQPLTPTSVFQLGSERPASR
jgi:hypothetical protein